MSRLKTLKPRVNAINTNTATTTPTQRDRSRAARRERETVLERDDYLCVTCALHGRVTEGTEVDHIIPLWQGGSDTVSNKQLLCKECHKVKTRKEAAVRCGKNDTGEGGQISRS